MRSYPFNMSSPVYDELFVNREKELRQTVDWITSGIGNLIISGERGIGKTSLALKAVVDTRKIAKDTLVMTETVYPFHSEGFDTFLSELGKLITITIWQKISGKSFSELFSEALDFEERKIEPKDIKALRRIYNILSASQLSTKASKSSKVGGKLVIYASTQEGLEKGMSRTSITSFEFLAILDELKEIAARHNFARIVIIADEFNYLMQSEQADFIRTYFQILNSRSIIFGLIGIDIVPWSIDGLYQCVEFYVPLGPFDSLKHVHELVSIGMKGSNDKELVDFLSSDEICSEIFKESKGNPRMIQAFCLNFLMALEDSKEQRDLSKAFQMAKRIILEQMRRKKEMLKR